MRTRNKSPRFAKLAWLLGFLGFKGFTYFTDGDPFSLFWFSYFSFFAYYFIAKMTAEMPDERYFENSRKAKLKTANIPLVTLFVVGFCSGFSFVTKEMIILTCALGWAVTIISYAFLFWYYDQHKKS